MTIHTIPTLCWSVAANPSPLGVKLHDAGYRELGLDFKYVALGSDNIRVVVDAVRSLGVRGLGVSMPHKIDVLQHVENVEPDVAAIGASNTVVNDNGVLTAYNTDWIGAQHAIDEAGLGDCGSALIVGAGGVARAIAYALAQRGVTVTVAARDVSKAETLVRELGLHTAIHVHDQATAEAELLVNATPSADALAISEDRLPRGVFDVAFQTRTTPLTAAASQLGVATVAGWRMLLLQAAAQFELYTGSTPPIGAMASILEDALPET